ncbi:MAG: hypothetical protein AB1449_12590 [Chloroflexota bacterium]
MDFFPFYRRPAFKTAAGLLIWAAAYFLLRRAAGDLPTFPLPFVVAVGLFATFVLFVFFGQLVPAGRRLATYPGEVLRLLAVAVWPVLHVWAFLPQGDRTAQAAIVHVDLALASLFLMTALASQFVLPVRTLTERATVIGRLLRHLAGLSGPVVFVHNGRSKESSREAGRRGPGVLLVDFASAAVLRTDVRFTGAVGPGLTFTGPGERLAEALDLRRQIRTLPATQPTTPEEAQDQRGTSLAVTRDGMLISAELQVTFMLHPGRTLEPREGSDPSQPPYDFHPIAAGRAVYGHAYGGQYDVPWTKLPMLLVVDLWREEVKACHLLDLFRPSPGAPSPLEEIRAAILQRLTSPTYPLLAPDGRQEWKESRDYRILHERGIRILDVGVSGLVLPEDVRDEHLLRWRETWSGAVREVLLDAEQRAEERRRAGRRQAVLELSEELTAALRARLAQGEPPNRRDTLAALLLDALRQCDRRERMPEGPQLAAHLTRIRSEILGLDGNCQPTQPRSPS